MGMIDIRRLMWSGPGGVPVVTFNLSTSSGENMDDVAEPRGPDPTTDSKVGGKPKKRKPGDIADQPTEPEEKAVHGNRREDRDKKRKRKKLPLAKQFTVVESR